MPENKKDNIEKEANRNNIKEDDDNLEFEDKSTNSSSNEENKEKTDSEKDTKDDGETNFKKEVEELNDSLLRLQADFQNYKRRSEEAKKSSIDYGVERVILDLLPAIDNFERALDSVEDEEDSFYKGIYLIYEELTKVMKKNKVEEIDALYKEFDPNLHHAVFMEESEEYEENIILEVLQKGYKLKDKVIRPSMVKVSK